MEAVANLKRIYRRLATKCQQPYSRMRVYANSNIAIALVRATHQCIQGYGFPTHKIRVQRLQWEDGAGIDLFR